MSRGKTIKRFWKAAHVTPSGADYTVTLDHRPLRTPAKAALALPSLALAQAVAAEWDAQVDRVDPRTMPMTRMANAAIDKVALQKAEVADMLAAYGDADLLCYRATSPKGLIARQAEEWDGLLDWAEAALGARLRPVSGVMHAPQDAQALAVLAAHVHDLTEFQLAGFHDLVSLSGSLIIGLAATRGHLTPQELWDRSRVDEDWQIEQWGEDDEAAAQSALKRQAFLDANRFFQLSS